MTQREPEDQYPPDEADRRRDDALRRALNMPAAPQEAMKVGKVKSSQRTNARKKREQGGKDHEPSRRRT
jgi:hypothetical protein